MDFEDGPITVEHLQGQLLALSSALIATLRTTPDPAASWVAVADHLATWLDEQQANGQAPPAAITGMRDMSAFLSIQASRPASTN